MNMFSKKLYKYQETFFIVHVVCTLHTFVLLCVAHVIGGSDEKWLTGNMYGFSDS